MNEIEKKFATALRQAEITGEFRLLSDGTYLLKNSNLAFTVEAQPSGDYFSGYVPDFAFYINNDNTGLSMGYIVEIDGYEWHEKSKDQARVDKEKDRAYLKNNFIPIRFTGYEVYHNPEGCVREVLEIIRNNETFFNYDEIFGKYHEQFCLAENYLEYARQLENELKVLKASVIRPLAILVKDGQVKPRKNAIEIGE